MAQSAIFQSAIKGAFTNESWTSKGRTNFSNIPSFSSKRLPFSMSIKEGRDQTLPDRPFTISEHQNPPSTFLSKVKFDYYVFYGSKNCRMFSQEGG